ncbi:MAG: hypothetical protein ACJ0GO_04115 [Gammaproteobacteria bacterium]
MKRKLLLVGLNELNFDLLKKYTDKYQGKFKYIEKLLQLKQFNLETEEEYKNLEPWIQWYSIHTGKKFEDHKVFRLGDAVEKDDQQIYELLEQRGKNVGAVSPMNALNKLKKPAYFIPDPWTETETDGSLFSKKYHEAISQTINDNSKGKISLSSLITVLFAFIFFSNKKRFFHYVSLAIGSIRARWKKALFLDLLTNDIHTKLLRKRKPDFSEVFLNSGAHIQHHYFRNSEFYKFKEIQNPDWYISSKADPFLDLLESFNLIVKDYFLIDDYEVIFSTGLSQSPIEPTFYYRLSNHEEFLKILNISFHKVVPRMTRDFTIYFSTEDQKRICINRLSSLFDSNGKRVFDEIEEREDSIFVTLTYSDEITESEVFKLDNAKINLFKYVVFVALKNGKHDPKSYTFCTEKVATEFRDTKTNHISAIYSAIDGYLI